MLRPFAPQEVDVKALEPLACLLDAYGALFLARRRIVGALVLAATFMDPPMGVCGLTAGAAALATRALLRLPGLPGEADLLNGIYAALALAAFHPFSPALLALAALGGVLVVPASMAIKHALTGPQDTRNLPLLGAPFLCVAWSLLSAARALGVPWRALYPAWPEWMPDQLSAVLSHAGALFYVANPASGLLVLAALLLASRAFALLAMGGSLLACALVGAADVPAGSNLTILAAFNGALTALFLGGALAAPSRRAILVAAGGVVAATLLSAALLAIFLPLGLPPLSAPFLLAVWLARGALRQEVSTAWSRHWLTVPASPEDSLQARRLAEARGADPASIALVPPFAGRMEVSQSVDGPHTHQGPWRYALDFIAAEDGRSFSGTGESLADFHCFGQPVLSPAWGYVVACRDDLPDNPPGQPNLVDNWGNHVLIGMAGGDSVLLAHLRQGSVTVAPGQAVGPGMALAQCGNSGRSSQPHLHLHVQRGNWLGAPTRPFHLGCYLAGEKYILNECPGAGSTVQAPLPEHGLTAGFALSAGREWTYAEGDASWRLSVRIGLLGDISLAADNGARVSAVGGPALFALYGRSGPEDMRLDAFILAFGLTPYAAGAGMWTDAASAALLPLSPAQRLRVSLRHPFGASLQSRYTREWDASRGLWVQRGEHHVAALGGAIAAQSTGWIAEDHGPVRFMLKIGERHVVDCRLAQFGNCGDHGVPAWSANYRFCPSP
jgi:urea transporter